MKNFCTILILAALILAATPVEGSYGIQNLLALCTVQKKAQE